MEEKLYLVIIDIYHNIEENSIVDICTTREKAEELMKLYAGNSDDSKFNYHIDEITIDYGKDVLWDCYDNNLFRHHENNN